VEDEHPNLQSKSKTLGLESLLRRVLLTSVVVVALGGYLFLGDFTWGLYTELRYRSIAAILDQQLQPGISIDQATAVYKGLGMGSTYDAKQHAVFGYIDPFATGLFSRTDFGSKAILNREGRVVDHTFHKSTMWP
jgi:hypothetical protein